VGIMLILIFQRKFFHGHEPVRAGQGREEGPGAGEIGSAGAEGTE
jgi:hypothetical protein